MKIPKIMGMTTDEKTEELFAEDGYQVLCANRIGTWGYAVDIKGGRGGHFRARVVRYRILTGAIRSADEKDTDRFELEKDSLDAAITQLAEFREFLG